MARQPKVDSPIELSFARGIDESQEATALPPGFLVSCKNWVPEPTGGLRARVGWIAGPDTGGKTGTGNMTNGSAILTWVSGPLFSASDVGKAIWVTLAGAGPTDLITTVASFTNTTHIVLADAATANASPGNWYMDQSNMKPTRQRSIFPTTRKVRGMAYVSGIAGSAVWVSKAVWLVAISNPQNGDMTDVYAVDASLGSSQWHFVESFGDVSSAELEAGPVCFAKGISAVLYSHANSQPDATPGIKAWSGATPPNPTGLTDSPSVRALAYHKDRFFGGGSDPDNSNWRTYRLYYSDPGVKTGWAGSGDPPSVNNNYWDVGKEDGESIEDLVSFEGQLMIGKASSVWIFTGAGPDTFAITRLEGANCAPGRSLIPTPSGLVILGATEAWMWRGGDPQLISPPVQSLYVANGASWRMGAYAGGKVYIAGAATNQLLLVFDVATGAWHTEDLGSDSEQFISIAARNSRLAGGPRAGTISSLLNYRDLPFGARAKDLGTLSPTFSTRTPDWYLTNTREPITLRRIWLQVRQRSGTSTDNALSITPYVDGVAQTAKTLLPQTGSPKVFYQRFDLFKTARSLGFAFSTTVPGSGGALWDIEKAVADVEALPARGV